MSGGRPQHTNISRRLSTNRRPNASNLAAQTFNLDRLLDEVSVHFRDLLSDTSNTLQTALDLMDTSSIGKAKYHSEYDNLKKDLQTSLKSYVDNNYEGFNSSIGSYRKVVQSVSESQNGINAAKELIVKARGDLATRRPILKELRAASLRYENMIQILDLIEELRIVPDKLELEIAQKQFLVAYQTLSGALRTADNEDLALVGGLQTLQSYLSTQESSLFSILVEELCNHLYLKSPYCDNRWSAYSRGSQEFNSMEQLIEDKARIDISEESWSFSGSAQLEDFLNSFDKYRPLTTDDRVSEENSFKYIRLIVETLGSMNRLPSAFDALLQRLNSELAKVIDKTVEEIRDSSPKSALHDIDASAAPSNLFEDYEKSNQDVQLSILTNLAGTLFSKFIAVLQGHRVVYEVVQGISTRLTGSQDQGLLDYDYFGAFKAVESEIKSLLTSYICVKKAPASGRTVKSPVPLKKTASVRSSKKVIFKFSSSASNDEELAEQYDLLKKKLEATVPGLVTTTGAGNNRDPYAKSGSSASHTLLVKPNVLNIRALLEPTVVFLQRAKSIQPYSERRLSRNADLFLDEFLANSFLPQLEDSLRSSFLEIMMDSQAFDADPQWSKLSKRPILRCASSSVKLLRMACKLLNTGFIYREKYATLVISAIHWLYEYFLGRYNEIMDIPAEGPAGAKKKAAATLLSDEALSACSSGILHSPSNSGESIESVAQESTVFVGMRQSQRGSNPEIRQGDLLEIPNYNSVCLMITSLRWVCIKLTSMRKVSEVETAETSESADSHSNLKARMKKRWTLVEATHATKQAMDESEYLSLAGKSAEDFDKAVENLVKLAETCIITLRYDLRCRCVYLIDRTMLDGDYNLDIDMEERDSYIGVLDSNIMACDEALSQILVPRDKEYIIRGLPKLLNEQLIYAADSLKLINQNGLKKMYRNILILQQMLKSISVDPRDVDFARAVSFYEHLEHSPAALMESIKQPERTLGYDEYKILIKLIYQEIIYKHEQAHRREAATAARNAMHDHLIEVHNMFWSSDSIAAR